MAVTLEGLSPIQAPGDLAHGNGAPDPRALELVGELQRQLPDTRVLLFGSRAIGDWRPGSDIDLAVIGGSKDAAADALAQLRSREPHPCTQLFHFTATEFDELRTSLPHVAGQVQAHGLTAEGEHLPPMDQDNPWPGVQELLHAARRKLEAALILFGTQPLTGEIVLSVHATLERCLKAALGAEGVDFRDHLPRNRQHNLCALAELLAAETPVDSTDVIPVEYLHELDAYQDTAPYKHDQQVEWPTTDNETLLAAAQRASLSLAGHALAMLGKTPRDIGYEHHIGSDALGGFGSVALNYYAHAKVGARERQHIENAGRVRDLHTLLGSRLTESQLARVESNWYTHNSPDDVLERLVAVMTNPATWLDLLVTTRCRENDADEPEVGDTPPPKGW